MIGVDWSEVQEDLLTLFSRRLHNLSVSNYLSFSCVCKSWQHASIATDVLPIPQPPFLMLADYLIEQEQEQEQEQEDDSSAPSYLGSFLGLTEGGREFVKKVYHLHLPESHRSTCVGSKGNWVVTVGSELKMHILNPFSRVQYDLPSQSTLIYTRNAAYSGMDNRKLRDFFINKVVLSSTPKSNNECVAVAIYSHMRFLAFTRLGDPTWTMIEEIVDVDDVVFFKGKIYAIDCKKELFICDFDSHSYRVTQVATFNPTEGPSWLHYLVQWMGELLVVDRVLTGNFGDHGRRYYRTRSFKVFKIDFATLKCNPVLDLGHYSLFLGFNASVSVLATESSRFRGNCIYFTEDHLHRYRHFVAERTRTFTEGAHDMGVFDFDKGVIQHIADDIVVTSRFSPPVWIIPESI